MLSDVVWLFQCLNELVGDVLYGQSISQCLHWEFKTLVYH